MTTPSTKPFKHLDFSASKEYWPVRMKIITAPRRFHLEVLRQVEKAERRDARLARTHSMHTQRVPNCPVCNKGWRRP